MSKLFIALFIVAASFSLAKGDILSDLINTDKADLSGLEIIRILLNPDQPIQDKIGQIFLEKAMKTLAKEGESIDLKYVRFYSFILL